MASIFQGEKTQNKPIVRDEPPSNAARLTHLFRQVDTVRSFGSGSCPVLAPCTHEIRGEQSRSLFWWYEYWSLPCSLFFLNAPHMQSVGQCRHPLYSRYTSLLPSLPFLYTRTVRTVRTVYEGETRMHCMQSACCVGGWVGERALHCDLKRKRKRHHHHHHHRNIKGSVLIAIFVPPPPPPPPPPPCRLAARHSRVRQRGQ